MNSHINNQLFYNLPQCKALSPFKSIYKNRHLTLITTTFQQQARNVLLNPPTFIVIIMISLNRKPVTILIALLASNCYQYHNHYTNHSYQMLIYISIIKKEKKTFTFNLLIEIYKMNFPRFSLRKTFRSKNSGDEKLCGATTPPTKLKG